jgi:hypothetical protein
VVGGRCLANAVDLSPRDAELYLTFLVDPQTDLHRHRRHGEGVWAIKASATLPARRQSSAAEITFSFGHGWAERLREFVSELARFRGEVNPESV